MRAPDIKRLNADGLLQMSLFDERDLAEITDPDRPGQRLVVCRPQHPAHTANPYCAWHGGSLEPGFV